MISTFKTVPIYLSTTLSETAERILISNLLKMDYFKSPWIQRRLASYPLAIEAEKDVLILELLGYLWKIPPSDRLFSVFKDFDKVFTILDKKGHFIHQFEVFLLGWHLINQLLEKDRKEIFKSIFGNHKRIFNSWLFASTAHDFGYPLQLAKDLAKKFSELYNKIHMRELSTKYNKLSKNQNIKIENELCFFKIHDKDNKTEKLIDIESFILDGIESSIEGNKEDALSIQKILRKNDHGYISAMILLRTYIDFLSKEKGLNFESEHWRIDDLKLVCASIALHNIPLRYEKYLEMISFNLNPYAYLLILIDNLQEWHRSMRLSDKYPSYNLRTFETKSDSISLFYILLHENWTKKMKNDTIKSLSEKAKLINLLKRPHPSFNFNISIKFQSNEGHLFDPISITL